MYKLCFKDVKIGEKFEESGVNPFEEPVVYTVVDIKPDNKGNNWYKLDSEHKTIYLPECDLMKNFVKIV